MAAKKVYELTQAGLDQLKLELADLKDVKRIENLVALKDAREQGDLSENADYDAARSDQARIESRIIDIENIIKNVKIIKVDDSSTINIGKEVVIEYVERKKKLTYQLVGTIEADPLNGKISIDSPIGKAIRGKEVGDIVMVKSETGKHFKIKVVAVN